MTKKSKKSSLSSSQRKARMVAAFGALRSKRRNAEGSKGMRMGSGFGLVRSAAMEAQRTRLPQMAAALSYRTIFGLIPVLFVALVALKMFASDEEISTALHGVLQFSGLSSISVEDVMRNGAALMGPFPEHSALPAAMGAPAEADAPVRAHLDQWITALVERVDSINFRAISIIGLLALIYAAVAMLVEIERSFNQIYRVPLGRSWARRVAQYWTLLTLGAIFLAATFYIGQRFTAWLVETAKWGDDQEFVKLAGAGYLTTVAISTVLFLLAYTIVPNTRVRLLPALCGAFVAALLWEASKWGFTQYLAYSAGYARLYGSIALIPLFMLWVYVTWVIVLSGLSVSYYMQHGRTARRRARVAAAAALVPPAPTIVDPGSILALMLILARRFEKDGRPVNLTQLASELSLERSLVAQMLDGLGSAGFIHRVAPEGGDGGDGGEGGNGGEGANVEQDASCALFVLARPPEQIDAGSVLNLAEGLVCPLSTAAAPVSQCMRRARHDAVRGRSLSWFLNASSEESPQPLPPLAAATAGRQLQL